MKEDILGRASPPALCRADPRPRPIVWLWFSEQPRPRDQTWYRLAEAAAQELGMPLTRGGISRIRTLMAMSMTKPGRGKTFRAPCRGGRVAKAFPGSTRSRAARPMTRHGLIRPSDALDLPEPATLSPLARDQRFKRGNVVHALLARLPDLAARRQRGAAALAFARAQRASTRRRGRMRRWRCWTIRNSPPPSLPTAAPRSRFSPRCRAVLSLTPGAQVNGRIDRLAVTDDEVLIVDFKTNRPPPAHEAEVSPVSISPRWRSTALRQNASFRGSRSFAVWSGPTGPS